MKFGDERIFWMENKYNYVDHIIKVIMNLRILGMRANYGVKMDHYFLIIENGDGNGFLFMDLNIKEVEHLFVV